MQPVNERDECNRSFSGQQSLDQHLNSPVHASLYKHNEYDRYFSGPQALQRHCKPPAHAPVYEYG